MQSLLQRYKSSHAVVEQDGVLKIQTSHTQLVSNAVILTLGALWMVYGIYTGMWGLIFLVLPMFFVLLLIWLRVSKLKTTHYLFDSTSGTITIDSGTTLAISDVDKVMVSLKGTDKGLGKQYYVWLTGIGTNGVSLICSDLDDATQLADQVANYIGKKTVYSPLIETDVIWDAMITKAERNASFEVKQDADYLIIRDSIGYRNLQLIKICAIVVVAIGLWWYLGFSARVLPYLIFAMVGLIINERSTPKIMKEIASKYLFKKANKQLVISGRDPLNYSDILYIGVDSTGHLDKQDFGPDKTNYTYRAKIGLQNNFLIVMEFEKKVEAEMMAKCIADFTEMAVLQHNEAQSVADRQNYLNLLKQYQNFSTEKLRAILDKNWLIGGNEYMAAQAALRKKEKPSLGFLKYFG